MTSLRPCSLSVGRLTNGSSLKFPLGHQERREREQQDLEFAKEMAEDDDDSFP